jgi:hypothetical protein
MPPRYQVSLSKPVFMKTCLISNEGGHDPPLHRMVVDGFGCLVDLKGIRISAVDPSSLGDPSIRRVEWGPVVRQDGSLGEQGVIIRTDGSRQTFFEKHLLNAYVDVFEDQKAKLMADHAAALAAEELQRKSRLLEQARQRQQYEAQEQHQREIAASFDNAHAAKTQEAADLAAEHARIAEKVAADIAAFKERQS